MKKSVFCLLLIAAQFCILQPASAEDPLTIAAGAGYKRLVRELCTAFSAEQGQDVQQIFGNMGQVTAQAKSSDQVDCIIGDAAFLDVTDLPFAGEVVIGRGKLIAAVGKGVQEVRLDALDAPHITRIAYPDSKKAIYGKAAHQFLVKHNYAEQLANKLLMVGTVPQVSAYVVSGEVDVGFINSTEALALEGKVGRLIPVGLDDYTPILIVTRQLARSREKESVNNFLTFLKGPEATQISRRHGL